jgi:hypothetical protein
MDRVMAEGRQLDCDTFFLDLFREYESEIDSGTT